MVTTKQVPECVAIKQEDQCDDGSGAPSGTWTQDSDVPWSGVTGAAGTDADFDEAGVDAGAGATTIPSRLLPLSGEDWGYPPGCPVAFRFRPSPAGRGDADFRRGRVASLHMDSATRQLLFGVQPTSQNRTNDTVYMIREGDIGYATGCPITIKPEGWVGEILVACPKFGSCGKVETIAYAVVLHLRNGGRRILSNVPAARINYRQVERDNERSASSEDRKEVETQPPSKPVPPAAPEGKTETKKESTKKARAASIASRKKGRDAISTESELAEADEKNYSGAEGYAASSVGSQPVESDASSASSEWRESEEETHPSSKPVPPAVAGGKTKKRKARAAQIARRKRGRDATSTEPGTAEADEERHSGAEEYATSSVESQPAQHDASSASSEWRESEEETHSLSKLVPPAATRGKSKKKKKTRDTTRKTQKNTLKALAQHSNAEGYSYSTLRVGSRVNVLLNGAEWQATILGDHVKRGKLGLMVHYEGLKTKSRHWISVDQVLSLISPQGEQNAEGRIR